MILKDENSKSSNSLYYCQKWRKSSGNKKGIYIYISVICISMYKELQLVAGKQRNLLCSLKILPFHCDKAVSLGGGQQHPFFSHQIPWDVARRWIWIDAIVHRPLKQLCTPCEAAPMKGGAAGMTDLDEGPIPRPNRHCLVWCWQSVGTVAEARSPKPGEEL